MTDVLKSKLQSVSGQLLYQGAEDTNKLKEKAVQLMNQGKDYSVEYLRYCDKMEDRVRILCEPLKRRAEIAYLINKGVIFLNGGNKERFEEELEFAHDMATKMGLIEICSDIESMVKSAKRAS